MRPGEEQPGGGPHPQHHPQWSQPHQPPGYQPGYQQPNPYQPRQPPPSGQWQQPGGVTGLPPEGGKGRGRARAVIAVVTAAAVIVAAVVTGVVVLGDDGGAGGRDRNAGGDGSPSPTGEPTVEEDEEQSTGGGTDPDDPRQAVPQTPDPVVAPDWQVQTIQNRHNAFDVPPDWDLGTESSMIAYEDDREGSETEGEPLVAMSGVSTYMDDWCADAEYGVSWRAVAGTKGGQGATSTADAARDEARTWALAAYDLEQRGRLEVSAPEPFESDHGITGHTATATITDVPEDRQDQCGTFDGRVVTVSYLDLNNDLATWVLVADTGFDGALDDETIERMMSSLRPFPEEQE